MVQSRTTTAVWLGQSHRENLGRSAYTGFHCIVQGAVKLFRGKAPRKEDIGLSIGTSLKDYLPPLMAAFHNTSLCTHRKAVPHGFVELPEAKSAAGQGRDRRE